MSLQPQAPGTPWGCILVVGAGLLGVTAFLFTGIGWMAGTTVMPEDPLVEVEAFDVVQCFDHLLIASVR